MKLYSVLGTKELVVDCNCPPLCSCAHEDTPPKWTERTLKWDPVAKRRTNEIVKLGTAWSPRLRSSPHHPGCTAPLQDHHPDCPNAYPSRTRSWVSAINLLLRRISFQPLSSEIPFIHKFPE